jgi:hypothetical protein
MIAYMIYILPVSVNGTLLLLLLMMMLVVGGDGDAGDGSKNGDLIRVCFKFM